MEQLLKEKTAAIVEKLYEQKIPSEEILVNIPPKEYSCDFTIVIFPIAKLAKQSPEQTAREIGIELKKFLSEIQSFEVVKGFLNLTIEKDSLLLWFQKSYRRKNLFGFIGGKRISRTLIEYCGPNTNKPLHLGHLRNIFIGYSMANILKAAGNEVKKMNIYNDRGIHICKSMLAYKKWGNNETPVSSHKKGDHFVGDYYVKFERENESQAKALYIEWQNGMFYNDWTKSKFLDQTGKLNDNAISVEQKKKIKDELVELSKTSTKLYEEAQEMLKKWEANDPEVKKLWNIMNSWVYKGFKETYRMLSIDFDDEYYESKTYQLGKQIVKRGLSEGYFQLGDDSSIYVDLVKEGLGVKVLLRADGTSVYITQDLATAELRYEKYHPDKMIYTVANEQEHHFKVLKLICKKLQLPFADGIYHLSYGMVDLPSGRMKSREGTVVDADDLIEEMISTAEKHSIEQGKIEGLPLKEQKKLFRTLGLGALKFFILKVNPKKRMVFNPEESIDFHGFTGPFIQYTHARIQSVIRKAKGKGIRVDKNINPGQKDMLAIEKNNSQVVSLQPQERELILHLQRFPSIIQEAASNYDPATLANYLYHLAKTYNQFYKEFSILSAENFHERDFRLQLSSFVASVINKGMKLLGIKVPERM